MAGILRVPKSIYKSVYISGIEWSISFFTNELDMLKRKRVKTILSLHLKIIFFVYLSKGLLLGYDIVDVCGDDGDGDGITTFLNRHSNLQPQLSGSSKLVLTIKTCLLVFHTDHILTIHLQKLMVNKEPIPSRSKHFSRSRGEKMESLEFYKFVGGSKHLAADESTTMEVIFPSLNWNPMCPDES